MHGVWPFVAGYLAFCAAGWIAIFWRYPDQAADFNAMLKRRLKSRPVRALVGALVTALTMISFLPLICAYCAWKCWRETRQDERFRRTYRPVEFLPLAPADLPVEVRDHFDQCTPIVEWLGFATAVTCQLKPPPKPVLVRCLLSRDGVTVADIAWICGSPALSFVSVVDGGHVLETACMEGLSPDGTTEINASGRFTVQWRELGQGWSFTDWLMMLAVYRAHQARLTELEQQFGRGALLLTADEIPALKRYENAVYFQMLFDQNKLDNRPQSQPCPRGTARHIGGSKCETGAKRCAARQA